VVIRAVNSHISYGYEYLGNPTRLILTPPSDRCIRSLIGAYHLNLNASVIGNSGKTETVKHLAKTLAKQCFVFGCSEELDIFTLGRLIKGFASSGAWLCLDDFNKMDPCVMSVIVPQLWTIHQSVAAKMETVMLDGTELPLNLSCFCIITMNVS
jgi:dynein heavy chain